MQIRATRNHKDEIVSLFFLSENGPEKRLLDKFYHEAILALQDKYRFQLQSYEDTEKHTYRPIPTNKTQAKNPETWEDGPKISLRPVEKPKGKPQNKP